MFGNKLRIALMVPCVNSVMRPELTQMAPEGIEIYETRMLMRGADKLEQLAYMAKSLPDVVESVMDVGDVFAYGCTSGSFTKGYAFDQELAHTIQGQTGRPTVTAAGSLVKALNKLQAKRISLATPYDGKVQPHSAGLESSLWHYLWHRCSAGLPRTGQRPSTNTGIPADKPGSTDPDRPANDQRRFCILHGEMSCSLCSVGGR